MDIDKIIRDRVRDRREYLRQTGRKNLTQEKMSELIGMARTTYANKESGLTAFTAEELARVAQELGVHPGYFYYNADENQLRDLPPDMEIVNGFHGRVINALPPGKPRERYVRALRERAESDYNLVMARLEEEEEQDEE